MVKHDYKLMETGHKIPPPSETYIIQACCLYISIKLIQITKSYLANRSIK
jgi:hypothetical protein